MIGMQPIEIKPPCEAKRKERFAQIVFSVQRGKATTYDRIVLAADSGSRASIARANPDDADGGAPEADESLDPLKHDAEQAKDGTKARIVSLQKDSARCAFACMG